jgi:radical SAM protein (TIGR01212 family)
VTVDRGQKAEDRGQKAEKQICSLPSVTCPQPSVWYNSYRSYLKEKFGKPVLKIPLNGGFSCPNRDGTKSLEGCLFCDNRSFSPAAENKDSSLNQLISKLEHASKFTYVIPYLQPFSNTYGSLEKLKSVYEPLLSVDKVVGIAVGTRPDCFSERIFDYLEDLSKRTYLSVELGLQSSHNETLRAVNRGHSYEDFRGTVHILHKRRIETVAHIILGLPGEDIDMMIQTAKNLSNLPVDGIKIHQLMIIKGTAVEKMHIDGKFQPFDLPAYTKVLCEFIRHLRPDQHIHRLMADARPESGLLAPLWSSEKSASVSFIHDYMKENGIVQGSAYR